MAMVWLGLALFFSVHSVPMLPPLRAALLARLGDNGWKGIHTLCAAIGLGLMIWGVARARAEGAPLWLEPRLGLRHAAVAVMAPVFPLLIASGVAGWIRARLVHPMLTGVILWAAAHLLVVGAAPIVAIAAAFLVWGLADRLSLAARAAGRPRPPVPPFGRGDLAAVLVGLALWAAFVLDLHARLIGVAPLG